MAGGLLSQAGASVSLNMQDCACRRHMDLGPKSPVKLRQRFHSSIMRLDINPSWSLKRCISTLFLPTWTLQHSFSRFILALRPSVPDAALQKVRLWAPFFLLYCSQKVNVLSGLDYTSLLPGQWAVLFHTVVFQKTTCHHGNIKAWLSGKRHVLLKIIHTERPSDNSQGHCNI